MSGGRFNYSQYRVLTIAEDIESYLEKNDQALSEETLREFHSAALYLKKAFVYAQRIDWLLSGDDDEETFHKRLKKDLETTCNDTKSFI